MSDSGRMWYGIGDTTHPVAYAIHVDNCVRRPMEKHTFIFTCKDNGGGYQSFEVRAADKQEAIRKGMKTAKKFACGDICGDWECKLQKEDGL